MEKEFERQGGSRDTGSPQKPVRGESCCMERQLCCLTCQIVKANGSPEDSGCKSCEFMNGLKGIRHSV